MKKQYAMSESERKKQRDYMRRYRAKIRERGGVVKSYSQPAKLGGRSYNVQVARLYVERYLSENPCVDCGYSDLRALEFDHVHGKKWFEISLGINRGFPLAKIMEEIEKCEVRCANCHRLRHKQ